MIHEDIEDALTTIFNNASNLNIIFIPSYDDGPEPVDPYGVVNVATYRKQHRDTNNSYITVTGSFEESIKQNFEVFVNVSIYGTGAYSNAFEASSLLSFQHVQQQLQYYNCISIVDVMEIQRVPEIRDTGTIQKATFDLNLLIGYENTIEVDWFDTVEYQGEYYDPADDLVYEEEATVSANDPAP